jgi:dTDP-4-dehydrorhamnose 3,5-epimerase
LIFRPCRLAGAFVLDVERKEDDRGFFARTFCARELAEAGLVTAFVQGSVSYNRRRGTLRGMHYQDAPASEAKLVRCTAGAIYDVLLDLRPGSPTYLGWEAVELSAETRRLVYVPRGFAHGFQTLTDEAEVSYEISDFYVAELARGVRWNDPVFGIAWPIADPILSPRDRSYPDFRPA